MEPARVTLQFLEATFQGALKGTKLTGQTEPKRRSLQIFADFADSRLCLENKAVEKRRVSQKTADFCRKPQKTTGTRRKWQIGVCPLRFVPLSVALTLGGPTQALPSVNSSLKQREPPGLWVWKPPSLPLLSKVSVTPKPAILYLEPEVLQSGFGTNLLLWPGEFWENVSANFDGEFYPRIFQPCFFPSVSGPPKMSRPETSAFLSNFIFFERKHFSRRFSVYGGNQHMMISLEVVTCQRLPVIDVACSDSRLWR